ncbi:polyketide cyclase [Rhodococcus sp. Leaf7]|uniref:SRPBCC family protein n=1 Tax=unclassified Rhodococcus (in: high G+C Gram-positive bacteria) TaxID=192944 RepID=UPI0006FED38B|nr:MULTISPECIES: SRPBCC family protein [unclassified Rhodococcus (in: high G+C Gram-positive bacteria)]KQU07232.1 polyketide cyclase [Rhodococcus sp. Leaf7]KQU42750.1 polyketide cyclase [Rhodococcus sp. Leaf247]
MTALEHSDSTVIAASADAVYALVSDVTRTGEWSPICQECWWNDGGSADVVGSTFTGRNVTADRTWETFSTVAVAIPGTEFAWLVGDSFVRWGYTLEAIDDDSTQLTESWLFTEQGIDYFHTKFGDRAQEEIEIRRTAALDGIPRTLAAIKAIAES